MVVIRDLAAQAARLFRADSASEPFWDGTELERSPFSSAVPKSAAFCEAEE